MNRRDRRRQARQKGAEMDSRAAEVPSISHPGGGDGESSANNRGRGARGGAYAAQQAEVLFPRKLELEAEERNKLVLASGETLYTSYTYDPAKVNGLLAVVKEYNLVDFGIFGNNSGKPTMESQMCVAKFNEYPRLLIDAISARGLPLSSTTFPLNDPSWPAYFNAFVEAYSILRTIMSLMESSYINPAFRRIAGVVGGSGIPNRVRQLWKNLQYLPVPKGLPKELDTIFGVIDPGEGSEDFAFITYVNTSGNATTITDFTDVVSVQALIAQASKQIDAMAGSGTALTQFIQEILARAYGLPGAFDRPLPYKSLACWDLHYTAATYLNDAASQNYAACPSITPTGLTVNNITIPPGLVPILKRRGGEVHPLLATLFRPIFYDGVDSKTAPDAAGNRSMMGLFTTGNQVSTSVRVYANVFNTGLDNSIQNDQLNDAQFAGGVFNVTGRAGSALFETGWWRPIVYSTLGSDGDPNWIYDTRSNSRWYKYNMPAYVTADATIEVLDRIWLTPVISG